jgi:hypothetical protein
MINSQGPRKLFLAVAAAALLTVTGCSNKATDEAANQAPAPQVPPKKAPAKSAAAKPATAKPAAAKTAAAKPAAKKPDSGKVVAAKSPAAKPAAKPVTASSKVTPATTLVTLPKGTAISATVDQALASNKNHAGDTFAAILSSSIKVDGKTVLPKGTHVTGRVVSAKKGTPELTVALSSVDLNGKSYKLPTDPINRTAKAPAKSDASDAKPAPKQDVTLAAQTRLKFKLAKPVKLPVAVKS